MPDVFRLLSIPWEQVGGEGANINKVFPYHSGVGIDWDADGAAFTASFANDAPHIQIQRTSGDLEGTYELYYYVNNAYYYDESLADTECEGDTFIPGWCDVGGVYAMEGQSEDFGELTPGVSVPRNHSIITKTSKAMLSIVLKSLVRQPTILTKKSFATIRMSRGQPSLECGII